ncbi:c-type cytochrome [Geomonas azotofigens]|uniref:c-type cytochrome n=1 Tax=Geomonas azotofigens TaxID=2843196 RepID=UPI001C1090E9|nr:c-type cytochrome [Geomonas azotofigens]MBU5613342.1 c-type cytochrome [Geomonas azotofigens]
MQRRLVVTVAVLALITGSVAGCKKKSEEQAQPPQSVVSTAKSATSTAPPAPSSTGLTGEQLFKQHCAVCHPNGGNTITPSKTLSAKAMADRSKITKPEDIVKIMRNPGPGMNKFDEGMISNDDAKKIGQYILATFP